MRILLVEDSPVDVRVIRRMLEQALDTPFEIIACDTRAQAIKELASAPFDLILLDLSLPDSHGHDTFETVHSIAPTPPIIVITGFKDETYATRAIQSGAQDYLVKGQFDADLLGRSIRYALERKRITTSLKEREQLLNSIFQAAPIGIGIVRDKNTEWVNDRLCAIVGYTCAEVEGKSCALFFADREEYERACAVHQVEVRNGNAGSIETRFLRKDGQIIDVLLNTALLSPMESDGAMVFTVMDISERKRATQGLQQELAVSESLSRLYKPLVSPDSTIQDIAANILEQAQQLIKSKHGYAATIDPASRDLVVHTFTDMLEGQCNIAQDMQRVVFPVGEGGMYPSMWGHALNSKQPFFTNDPTAHAKSINLPQGHIPIDNFLSVPVLLGEELVGQIALANKEEGFSPSDMEAAKRLARYYALAIQRLRFEEELKDLTATLEERVRQRTYQLEVTSGLARELSAALNYQDMFRLMMTHLDQVVRYDVAASLFKVDGSYQLYVQSCCPMSDALYDDIKQRMVEAVTGLGVSRSLVQARIIQASKLDTLAENGSLAPLERLDSSFEVPLVVGEEREVGGLLFVAAQAKDRFSREQVDMLRSMAEQMAMTIERLRELIEAEKGRLATLLENLPLGVVLLDASGRIILANPIARGCLPGLTDEYSTGELSRLGGRPLQLFLSPPPRGMSRHELKTNKSPQQTFLVSAQKLESGPLLGCVVLTIRDVTDDKAIEERARQQDRLAAVGQLAAGIAHDFNNLLSAIGGYGELILDDQDATGKIKYRAGIIKEQVDRAANLVRQILDFSRKSISAMETLDYATFLKETVKLLERTLPATISLRLDIQPDVYLMKGDPTGLQQILTNLVVNAQQAMPGGGTLSIGLDKFYPHEEQAEFSDSDQTGWIVLSVVDTGSGIPEDVMDHIFDPFFTTKKAGEGTGLGLAQVYGIVGQHSGFIEVNSREGEGTAVTIFFPAIAPDGERKISAPRDMPRGNGETILLVEDEPLVLQMGSDMLESLNYAVVTARNGVEALEVAKNEKGSIRLMITDMVMPKMGGMELVEALKKEDIDVPVIIWTGYPLGKSSDAMRALSVSDWIMKPPRRDELAVKIQKALDEGSKP